MSTTISSAPRSAVRAAHLAALTPLPSAAWRLGLAVGLPVGATAAGRQQWGGDGGGWVYLVALCVLSEAAALATVFLVRPRGRALLARRGVRVTAYVAAGVLTVLWTPMLAWWWVDHPDLTTSGARWVGLAYLPLVLWGPLLAVVASYARRDV